MIQLIKKLSIIFVFLFSISGINAQIFNPAHWKFEVKDSGSGNAELLFKVTLDNGWHIYDMNLPDGGPVSTSFAFEKISGAELVGKPVASSKPVEKYDPNFEMNLRWFSRAVTFSQKIKVTDIAKFSVAGGVNFMVCDDKSCLPATTEEFSFTKKMLPAGVVEAKPTQSQDDGQQLATTNEIKKDSISQDSLQNVQTSTSLAVENTDYWKPVIEELRAYGSERSENASFLYIFAVGFLGGLIALLTPCVWPMIPMTVSFFLKRTKNRKKAISDALTYGLSIIVIYLALGLIITAIFGASALNDLSTNAFFNLLFFAILVFFAISFFGAFELVLPSSWTNKLDSKAESTTGLISIFFMAFTLVLVSFSCTGPIIGTLLVEAASLGSMTGPAIGMAGFALALSIPFALFAIFPSWLQNMPKSGGWLNSVKVVLGFLELALALKFLSVADLAYKWHILDREVFLVLWIIIFTLLGIYLLGKIKFAHDSDLKYVSVPRLFMAIISLSFAVYMVPGLWGAPLKAISAFAPPLYTQDFSLYHGEVKPKTFDYEEGMAMALKNKKPVMIDFTGYGCVNCRNMEAAVWTDPRVKNIIDNQYILISLYVDDKTPLSKVIQIEEFGVNRKLKTVGDKWSYFQRSKFGANAQPFYVLLDNKGYPIGPSYVYDKDIEKYIQFLNKGIEEYKKRQ